MTTMTPSQPPPLAELVRAISAEVAVPHGPPSAVVMHLPRPHLLSRVLLVGAVLLIALMAVLLVTFTQRVQELMADIKAQEDLRANPPLPALPDQQRLIDAATFANDCAARPAETGRLHLARANALMAAGRPAEAIAGFAEAVRVNDAPLAAIDRIALGDALLATGQVEQARALLLGTDVTGLDATTLERSKDVLGRAAMAGWRLERPAAGCT